MKLLSYRALLIVISFFLIACSEQNRTPLSVGTNLWPGYEPLYVAKTADLWDNKRIKMVEFTSASEVIRAFRNGTLDVAALTLDEAISLMADQPDTQIILGTDFSDGGDVVIAQAEIKEAAQLKGKRVGVESTALGAYMLTRFLEENGLSPADVVPVYLQVNEHFKAFQSKAVDAVVTFDPVRAELLKGPANILFSSADIPQEVVDVLVASAGAIATKSEQIQMLVQGWSRSIEFIRDKPDIAYSMMMPRLGMTHDELLESLTSLHLLDAAENKSFLGGEQALVNNIALKVQSVMLMNKLLQNPVFKEKNIYSEFVDAL